MPGTVIYLHGFLSVGVSEKSTAIKQAFPDAQVLCPDLSFDPMTNTQIVADLIKSVTDWPLVFVGTSLGGFWANYFAHAYDAPCIIVNPCVSPSEAFKDRIGAYKNLVTGEAVHVTDTALGDYQTFEHQASAEHNGYLVNLLVAEDDDVIPYKPTLDYFKHCKTCTVTETGGHRYASEWHRVIDLLREYL